eukprot:2209983-Pyramimonas_sp.AAC.1
MTSATPPATPTLEYPHLQKRARTTSPRPKIFAARSISTSTSSSLTPTEDCENVHNHTENPTEVENPDVSALAFPLRETSDSDKDEDSLENVSCEH